MVTLIYLFTGTLCLMNSIHGVKIFWDYSKEGGNGAELILTVTLIMLSMFVSWFSFEALLNLKE